MITVQQVTTRRQQKQFLDFPLKLYKDCKCYIPPLYSDEKKIFRKDYVYNETCEHVYFNAYKDGVQVCWLVDSGSRWCTDFSIDNCDG